MKTLGFVLLAGMVIAAIQAAMEILVRALEPSEEERERCDYYATLLRSGHIWRMK